MRLLYLVAKTFGGRPSDYVGVRDKWAAYQLDAAVLMASLGDEDEDGAGPVSSNWDDIAG
jgi:hypothetical protein